DADRTTGARDERQGRQAGPPDARRSDSRGESRSEKQSTNARARVGDGVPVGARRPGRGAGATTGHTPAGWSALSGAVPLAGSAGGAEAAFHGRLSQRLRRAV